MTARAKPPSPITALASTAAVAGPPTRWCKMIMMLVSTIGNTARLPLAVGPMRKLKVTTTPTSSATMPARSTRSYHRRRTRGIGAWRNGADSQKENPITTMLSTIASGSVQATQPLAQMSTSHEAKAPPRLIASERFCASSA